MSCAVFLSRRAREQENEILRLFFCRLILSSLSLSCSTFSLSLLTRHNSRTFIYSFFEWRTVLQLARLEMEISRVRQRLFADLWLAASELLILDLFSVGRTYTYTHVNWGRGVILGRRTKNEGTRINHYLSFLKRDESCTMYSRTRYKPNSCKRTAINRINHTCFILKLFFSTMKLELNIYLEMLS